jgi:Ni/Co efflux regulator RcnB
MKRILLAAAATLAMTAPLAAPAFADPGHGYQPSYDRRDDRRDNRRDDRRDNRTVVVVKHDNKPFRDSRANGRWDDNRYNGYYVKNVWHFGPPPVSARGYVLGYKPWARGDRLGYYGARYREVDYRSYRLNAPPRGYHYVRDDNTGEIILAAIATGIIASIIAH